jgi:hypothetical protein
VNAVTKISYIDASVSLIEGETATLLYQDEIAIFVPTNTVPTALQHRGQPVRLTLESDAALRIARIDERQGCAQFA